MRVLVTGGSGGIGTALVQRLRAEGDQVVFTFCGGAERARSLAADTGAEARHYDQTAPESVAACVAAIREGTFDALVNNASQPAQRQLLLKVDLEGFLAYQSAALRGVFALSTAFAEQVKRRGGPGRIVNVLTAYTFGMPPAKLTPYVTSKHALLGLTRSMAVEFIRYGIRVNAVSPGLTRTNFIADLPERFLDELEAGLPMERFATPQEIAAVIRFLLSDDAAYINGANIPVAGGHVC